MKSIKEIAEEIANDAYKVNSSKFTIARAVEKALRDRDDRAAKICETGAMLASPDGVIPQGDPEHERLQRLSEVLTKAADAIRAGD